MDKYAVINRRHVKLRESQKQLWETIAFKRCREEKRKGGQAFGRGS